MVLLAAGVLIGLSIRVSIYTSMLGLPIHPLDLYLSGGGVPVLTQAKAAAS
jgi:hypothetical protein